MDHELSSDSAPLAGSTPARSKPLDWPQAAGRVEPVARAIEVYVRRQQQQRRRAGAMVAALAVVMVAGVVWRSTFFPDGATPADSASVTAATNTRISLPARQTLPDGSVVDLKPGAEISVQFTSAPSGQRRVVLKHGEAHFTVTKDPLRPFIVEAGGLEVRAVGTAFSVEQGGGEVAVLVTEGRVALDQSASAPTLAFVDAGSRAVVSTDAPIAAAQVQMVSAAESNERLAWRVPRLEFNATPIAEVVTMFNRHAVAQSDAVKSRLILAEGELGTLPLSGVLRADNIAVLLQIMESSYGITAERRASGEIVLRKRR